MTHRKHYSLSDLMAQCDLSAPMPEAFREWDQMVPVGLEQEITQQAADVILQAIRVFESQELAFDWLQRPIPALDGEKPFDLLGTDEGCSSVTSAIQKIAWGDFS